MDDRNDANGVNDPRRDSGTNGTPEYGAYAPQGQPTGAHYPYGGAPDANAGMNGQAGGQPGGSYAGGPYAGDGQPQYGQPYAYQPNSNPYGGNPYTGMPWFGGYQQNGYPPNQGMPGPDGGTPHAGNPFRLIEEILPDRAKSTIRSLYGVIGE